VSGPAACSEIVAIDRAYADGENIEGIQPSPSVAARRMAGGLRPATMIGGPWGCAGNGAIVVSASVQAAPARVTFSRATGSDDLDRLVHPGGPSGR